jgi:probable HAF family extracellular repeat protein
MQKLKATSTPGGSTTRILKATNSRSHIAGRRFGIVALALLMGACPLSPRSYVLTDLGVLPGDTSSEPTDINESRQIVGFSTGPNGDRAFVWDAAGGIREVGDLPGGAVSSHANGINDAGQIVGWSVTWNNARHAFLFTPGAGQGMRDLGDLPGGADFSWAADINSSGHVVGTSMATQTWHAFLWTNGRGLVDLGALALGESVQSEANAINDSGQITGTYADGGSFRAFIATSSGSLTRIGPGSTGQMNIGYKINNSGQIAGVGARYLAPNFLSNVSVAFNAHGSFGDALPDLAGRPASVSADYSAAYGVNDDGDVVGWSYDSVGPRAVVWGYMFGLHDLNSRIHSCDPLRNSVILTEARAINNKGDIAAVGVINGQTHAFLLRRSWLGCGREDPF